MLKETYETAGGTYELEILKREEETQIVNFAETYIKTWDRTLFTVRGFAGCGKSYLVKNAVESIRHNHGDIFCAYLDVSDCVDESEVYYKIALQLRTFYKELDLTVKNQMKQEIENANVLIRLYEWVKGIYREDLSVGKERAGIVADIAAYINEKSKGLSGKKVDQDDSTILENLVEETLLGLSKMVPVVSDIRRGIDTLTAIKDNIDRTKFKRLLLEKVDVLDNRVMRENYLLGKLKKALPENAKRIIVLDNFQLDQSNELGKNYMWLTTQNKLMRLVNAMWIVVSRMSARDLFEDLFQEECCYHIELNGFDQSLAEEYLIRNCLEQPIYQTFDYLSQPEQELVLQMLEVADLNHNKCYLPYLLRMIVLYYWKVKETPGVTVTAEMFLNLDTEEDFIGYYFYKDLSDLMVNAFQILSCLSVWDDVWINTVQKKIDNHLLNARNLLEHKAPIESLGPNSFKLHEALKEGLYKNRQNYIKKDVMKHLFESFIKIYEGTEAKENKNIWYDLKRLRTFVEIVFSYLDLDKEHERENLKAIRKAMGEIYRAQKARGTVSEVFIRIYCFYIDELKKIYNVPFANTLNNNFENENPEQWGYRAIADEEQEELVYYMTCCFNLADLYTNHSQNGIAQRLEELCVQFWDNLLQKITNNAPDLHDRPVWYYRCWQQKVKALNATAYDYSAEHCYKKAYAFGKLGLEETEKLGSELLKEIEPEQAETLLMLLNPDNSEMFSINGAYTEIPYELYGRMQQAYTELWKMKYRKDLSIEKDNQNAEKAADETRNDLLKGVLGELLLKNQQDLRGNFPWYCLMNEELMVEDEEQEKSRKRECVLYGVRTYWMRRVMLEVLKKSDLKTDKNLLKNVTERMLKSYHNICVYLSKNDELEKACFLGNEVLKESQKIMHKGRPNQKAMTFMQDVLGAKKEDAEGLLLYLWKRQGVSKEIGEDFFSQPANIIEQIQYLGDFYLHMGYYSFALQCLSVVMLMRGGSLETSDSKALDTTLRFYIAVYAEQKRDGNLLQKTEEYINQHIIKQEEYIEKLRENHEAKGVLEKFEKMARLLALGSQNGNVGDIVVAMLSEIDSEEREKCIN